MGKLIVIEGCDGAGKETQSKLLVSRLNEMGIPARRITFPDYDSPSSGPVKMYLKGDFGKNDEVEPYAASSLYAVDRWAAYRSAWHEDYEKGVVIVADRYTGSNAMFQGAKFTNQDELKKFVAWLEEFEFHTLGIPAPDKTLFLDVPPVVSKKLTTSRYNKATGGAKKDIHESDINCQNRSYNTGHIISEMWRWEHIECTDKGEILPKAVIAEKIWAAVKDFVVKN